LYAHTRIETEGSISNKLIYTLRMALQELHRDEEFVLYEYTDPSERPTTPNALQYQEAYRDTNDGSTFYRLYEFIGDNRKINIFDFFNSKIGQAKEAGDTRAVDQFTSLKSSYER
jgi:hypothetical protein